MIIVQRIRDKVGVASEAQPDGTLASIPPLRQERIGGGRLRSQPRRIHIVVDVVHVGVLRLRKVVGEVQVAGGILLVATKV